MASLCEDAHPGPPEVPRSIRGASGLVWQGQQNPKGPLPNTYPCRESVGMSSEDLLCASHSSNESFPLEVQGNTLFPTEQL